MDALKPLADFFRAIEKDGRISTTHISIYAALLQYWQENGCQNPVNAYSHDIMRVARVLAQRTYHTKVKDLNAFGYIRYEPSFKRNCPSKVFILLNVESNDRRSIEQRRS